MEIRANDNAGGISPALPNRVSNHPAPPLIDHVNLDRSVAVNRALAETPEVRPEVVERARPLVGDPTYPPQEAIQSLAHLLAMRLPPS